MDINQAADHFFAYAITHPPVYVAFVLICLGIIAGTFVFAHKKDIQSRISAINPEGYLTFRQQQALNVGAIMGAMFGDYCNSLQTKKLRKTTVIIGWGIHSAADAKDAIDKIITGEYGQRVIFDQILGRIANDEDDPLFEDYNVNHYIRNLHEALPLLQKEGVIGAPEEITGITTLAWDMGRLVNISRWSFDLEYITEDEAWRAIAYAYGQVLAAYRGWQDFAQAYLIGRAMWGGLSREKGVIPLKTVVQIAKRLQNHPASPWKFVPFRGNEE